VKSKVVLHGYDVVAPGAAFGATEVGATPGRMYGTTPSGWWVAGLAIDSSPVGVFFDEDVDADNAWTLPVPERAAWAAVEAAAAEAPRVAISEPPRTVMPASPTSAIVRPRSQARADARFPEVLRRI
jgi:hypothetical protein